MEQPAQGSPQREQTTLGVLTPRTGQGHGWVLTPMLQGWPLSFEEGASHPHVWLRPRPANLLQKRPSCFSPLSDPPPVSLGCHSLGLSVPSHPRSDATSWQELCHFYLTFTSALEESVSNSKSDSCIPEVA